MRRLQHRRAGDGMKDITISDKRLSARRPSAQGGIQRGSFRTKNPSLTRHPYEAERIGQKPVENSVLKSGNSKVAAPVSVESLALQRRKRLTSPASTDNARPPSDAAASSHGAPNARTATVKAVRSTTSPPRPIDPGARPRSDAAACGHGAPTQGRRSVVGNWRGGMQRKRHSTYISARVVNSAVGER
jgi:hypothetical protein